MWGECDLEHETTDYGTDVPVTDDAFKYLTSDVARRYRDALGDALDRARRHGLTALVGMRAAGAAAVKEG